MAASSSLAWHAAWRDFSSFSQAQPTRFKAFLGALDPTPSDNKLSNAVGPELLSRVEEWLVNTTATVRLARFRTCVGMLKEFEAEERAMQTAASRLLSVWAFDAAAQRRAAQLSAAFECPSKDTQWIGQFALPIAAAAHITHGQGCVVERRDGRWFPGNLIRTSALPAIEANDRPGANPHVEYLGREMRTMIERKNTGRARTKPVLFDPDGLAPSIDEFVSSEGAKPFVLDDRSILQPEDLGVLSQVGMPVVPLSKAEDQDDLLKLVEDLQNDLASMMANAGSHSHSHNEERNQAVPTTNNFHAPIEHVSTGDNATHITHNQNQGTTLNELLEALQSLQVLLAQGNPNRPLVDDVIRIAKDNEPLTPEKKGKIEGLLITLKAAADGADSIGQIADNVQKAGEKVGQISATVSTAIMQYWPQLSLAAASLVGGS